MTQADRYVPHDEPTARIAYVLAGRVLMPMLTTLSPPMAPTQSDSTELLLLASIVDVSPWIVFRPDVALFVIVVGLNFAGDAVRDAFDPRKTR